MHLEKHSRRKFIQLAAAGAGLSMVYLWEKMMGKQVLMVVHKKVILPMTRKLVTFYGNYIVVFQHNKTKVFSAHCTHLGCIINKVENGRLICPCHGSEFNLEGIAVKGPAYKPLPSIPFREDDKKQEIIIQSSVS